MYARSLGLVAAAAVATNAILLPPEISSATLNTDNELAALGIVDPENQLISVPSGKCLEREGDCSLLLSINTAGQPKTLLINGVPFYTSNPEVTANAMNTPVMITELDKSDTVVDYVASPDAFASKQLQLTGSAFETGAPEFTSDTGEQVVPMSFQIYTLNGKAVNVPRVSLKVLKSTEGELMVLSVSIQPVDPMAHPEDKICADWPMVCQVRDYLMSKANAAKEGVKKLCKGKPKNIPPHPHFGGPPFDKEHHPHGPHRHHGPPHGEHGDHPHGPPGRHGPWEGHRGMHGHHGHHDHHDHHRHGFAIVNVLLMIIGAIMMLMATWVLGYIIGTVVGYSIVGLWLLYRRMRGTPKYQRVALEEADVVVDEKMLDEAERESNDMPREDPPAYEEKEVVV